VLNDLERDAKAEATLAGIAERGARATFIAADVADLAAQPDQRHTARRESTTKSLRHPFASFAFISPCCWLRRLPPRRVTPARQAAPWRP
jgi:hypothetical protein